MRTCPKCSSPDQKKNGRRFTKSGAVQIFKCGSCGHKHGGLGPHPLDFVPDRFSGTDGRLTSLAEDGRRLRIWAVAKNQRQAARLASVTQAGWSKWQKRHNLPSRNKRIGEK